MAIASDPSPEADAAQIETYRRMGGTARAEAMFRLTRMARGASEAGIRSRHPDHGEAQVRLALARRI
jgi:hypothetical protein